MQEEWDEETHPTQFVLSGQQPQGETAAAQAAGGLSPCCVDVHRARARLLESSLTPFLECLLPPTWGGTLQITLACLLLHAHAACAQMLLLHAHDVTCAQGALLQMQIQT